MKRRTAWLGLLVSGAIAGLIVGAGVFAQKGPEQPPPAGEVAAPTPELPPGWDSTPSIPKIDPPGPTPAVPPAQPICELEPVLCQLAADILVQARNGDSSLLASTVVAFPAACAAGQQPPHLRPLCDLTPGRPVEGFSFSSKGPVLLARADFVPLLEGALRPQQNGRSVGVELAGIGCAQPSRQARPICERGFAISFLMTYGPEWQGVVVLLGLPHAARGQPGIFGLAYEFPEGGVLEGGPERFGGLFPGREVGLDFYFQRWADQANPPR